MYERLELYIETLTGTAFELRVSPYETVQDVKARIQKLEGIPISQQHLIWQTIELEDDYCLSDYTIPDGATLKLVLNMRGGPINTRRIPMDEPSIRDMAEYFSEASKDEMTDRVPNRPVTVIVYHNGDQLNFFRVVDRESTSPLSESLSVGGASMFNLYDDDGEDDDGPTHEKLEENDKTREKMKLLKSKMENMTLNKKQPKKLVPRPPSASRPGSKARLRRLAGASGRKSASLNRNQRLPPVGQSLPPVGQSLVIEDSAPADGFDPDTIRAAKELFESAAAASSSDGITLAPPLGIRRLQSVDSATKLKPSLTSVLEDRVTDPRLTPGASPSSSEQSINCDTDNGQATSVTPTREPSREAVMRRAQMTLRASRKYDFSQELLLKNEPKPPSAPRRRDPSPIDSSYNTRSSASNTRGLETLLEKADIDASGPGRPLSQSRDLGAAAAGKDSSAGSGCGSSNKHGERRPAGGGGVVLESLHPSEVRAMSGMLSSLVRSASKSRAGFLNSSSYKDAATTPEVRMLSSRLRRRSAGREGRCVSPSYRLPPVKQKKKTKRCNVCAKKTTLTNAYTCRCSNNFCATHRYPEAHNCTFDYKTEGRKLLEQNNPVVNAPKLPKI